MLLKIIAIIGEILIKFGLKKKAENDAAKADALEQTVESVNKSLEVEADIRDKQSEVDKTPTDVNSEDGGMNFDNFNSGK